MRFTQILRDGLFLLLENFDNIKGLHEFASGNKDTMCNRNCAKADISIVQGENNIAVVRFSRKEIKLNPARDEELNHIVVYPCISLDFYLGFNIESHRSSLTADLRLMKESYGINKYLGQIEEYCQAFSKKHDMNYCSSCINTDLPSRLWRE